jgi:hypothetical protein
VLVHEPQEQAEPGPVDGFRDVGTAHVVDHHRTRERREQVPVRREVGGLEVDDDVPAELRDQVDESAVVGGGLRVHQPAHEVEPDAAHAGVVHVGQFRAGDAGPDRRHPTGPVARRP